MMKSGLKQIAEKSFNNESSVWLFLEHCGSNVFWELSNDECSQLMYWFDKHWSKDTISHDKTHRYPAID